MTSTNRIKWFRDLWIRLEEKIGKFPLLLVILSIIIGSVLIPIYLDTSAENITTKEDLENMQNQIITDIEKLLNLSEYNIEIKCDESKSPIWKDGAVFVDKCVVMDRPLSLNRNDLYLVDILFRSDWQKSESEVHQILSIHSESNEMFVIEENNLIKMKVASDNAEQILKLPLNEVNWKDEWYSNEWNNIKIMWNPNNKNTWLEVNGVRSSIFGDIEIDFSNATFFLGTSNDNKYFAEGWFKDIKSYSSPGWGNVSGVLKNADAESSGSVGEVWKQLMFYGSTPEGTSVDIFVNTSRDNITWSGWNLVQSNASSGKTYDIPPSYQKRYGLWRLTLKTNYPSLTPSIHGITFMSDDL